MITRTATLDDLEAIMTLEHRSFPGDAWSAAMMREELASPHGWYVVVEEAGRLVGYAGLRAPSGAKDADIQTITIDETFRGRGRGRALLTTLLGEAARRGARGVFLEVRADNPVARELYASEGFAEIAVRPRYYQPDDVDAVVMKLDLRAWVAARAPSSLRSSENHANLGGSAENPPRFAASSEDPTGVAAEERADAAARSAGGGKGWC